MNYAHTDFLGESDFSLIGISTHAKNTTTAAVVFFFHEGLVGGFSCLFSYIPSITHVFTQNAALRSSCLSLSSCPEAWKDLQMTPGPHLAQGCMYKRPCSHMIVLLQCTDLQEIQRKDGPANWEEMTPGTKENKRLKSATQCRGLFE